MEFRAWTDLATPDPEAAKEFYGQLFGWTFETDPTDQPGNDYIMCNKGDAAAAGIMKLSDEMAASGMPPVWSSYVTVADIDATAEKVAAAGGQVMQPPFDVMKAGRMAVFGDPSGAAICGWQAKEHIGAEVVNEHGALTWNELMTPDPRAVADFYEAVFGWKANHAPMEGMEYTVFMVDGGSENGIAGAMKPPMEDAGLLGCLLQRRRRRGHREAGQGAGCLGDDGGEPHPRCRHARSDGRPPGCDVLDHDSGRLIVADSTDDGADGGFDPESLPRVPSADHSLPGTLELGGFSISLTVADLDVSRAFYEKLGFEVTGGDAEGGWLILKNGETTLGLFSGMFERNMLTFNPGLTARMERIDSYTDVRDREDARGCRHRGRHGPRGRLRSWFDHAHRPRRQPHPHRPALLIQFWSRPASALEPCTAGTGDRWPGTDRQGSMERDCCGNPIVLSSVRYRSRSGRCRRPITL
ncbi:MAG: VOC family protein [Microthrixaceae bacterium]